MNTSNIKSIVQLTASETALVQELYYTTHKRIQVKLSDQFARTRVIVRLAELFRDEIETNC